MYLALYRKYRPSTFDDVISQEHITTTLKNQIITGQIAHAYLFTGTRGTGKTSCAKIMAKAVNCLSPKNGNPCGECASCKAIENGTTDVIEIDAASNNGVDNIRQLRDEVIYTPIDCKYKVYIIDEVHMLSPGAFNALLKTLEEPPSHAVFILATTEYYKVPATILSRCQQFLFSKIDAKQSSKRLLDIAEKENINLDESAAELISRLSDGAMRDALSLLDQCISVSNKVNENLVRQCSGAAESEYLFAVSDAALNKSPAAALKLLDSLISQGKDISRFVEELTLHYRNLMLEKTVGEELIKASKSELEQYRKQCDKYSLDEIMYHIDLISDSLDNINRMKQTGQARLLTEQLLIRLTSPKLTNDASALAGRIGALETQLGRLTISSPAAAELNAPAEYTEKLKAEIAVPASETSAARPENAEIPAAHSEKAEAPAAHSENTKTSVSSQNTDTVYNEDIPLPPPPPEVPYYEGVTEENIGTEHNPFLSGSPQSSRQSTASDLPEPTKSAKSVNAAENKNITDSDNISKENPQLNNHESAGRPITETDLILPKNASPLPQWQEIIAKMPVRSKAFLKKSQAYLYDGKIYLISNVTADKVFKDGEKAEKLRSLAKEALGAEMEMYIASEPAEKEEEEQDRALAFLGKAKNNGINITIK